MYGHEKEGVETTPQTFIDGERIGGFDDLRVHFGLDKPQEEQSDTSYQPVIAIFGVAFLMALGLSWYAFDSIFTWNALERLFNSFNPDALEQAKDHA